MSQNSRQLMAMAMQASRGFATAAATPTRKVAVMGAGGGIGQPLSLLMKMNSLVSHLSLYDIAGTKGVAADCSHINSKAQVQGFEGADSIGAALRGCDLVIIPAGIPRKPGMTRDDLFKINAGIVAGIIAACGKHCPGAMINIISNPVNSTVPIAAEVLKKMGLYDRRKILGVTTLDVVRAKTFYAEKNDIPVSTVDVPVIGGHAGITILPLFSQATPKANMSAEVLDAMTERTQNGGTEVVEAKAGKGSATLSMAYAGALFADACLRGLNGQLATECTYVESTITDSPFFASKVRLSTEGVDKIMDLGVLSDYEKEKLNAMMPDLISQIEKGIEFGKAYQI
jgi:malate dehydrogenase